MAGRKFLDDAYGERDVQETRAFYNAWAKVYDEEVGEHDYRQPLRCANALSSNLDDHSALIADIGCGTGLSGLALNQAGFSHIEGCDLSPGMLEKASKSGVYNTLFEVNLNEPPFPRSDNYYDAITAVGVFSFGHVQADALHEFIRISKPGAPIIIGLNDHFYQEGSLTTKINALASQNLLIKKLEEEGDHLPGIGLTGWVITLINSKA